MSHKVTFKSTINNSDMLVRMLDRLKLKYAVKGPKYTVTSNGYYQGATIDPSKGEVTGDSDWINKETIQRLNQAYSEEEVLYQIALQGASVESREIDRNGAVVIMCRMHG